MSIYNKYLKYKIKYLDLKKQLGGVLEGNPSPVVRPVMPAIPKQEIYMPFFHSCHLDTIETVPKGSMVVFTSSCGLKVSDDDPVSSNIRRLFLSNDPLLQDPKKNRNEIIKILGHPISIHSSTENNKFLDLRFSLHGLFNDMNTYECSGLHLISSEKCDKLGFTLKSEAGKIFISKANALKLYRNSVYPTETDIERFFNDRATDELEISEFMKMIGDIKLSELLEKFPGIYYIFGCRQKCKGIHKDTIERQRRDSISRFSEEENIISIEKFISSIVDNFIRKKKFQIMLEQEINSYIEKYGKTDFILTLKDKISALIREEKEKYYYIRLLQIKEEIRLLKSNSKRSYKTIKRDIKLLKQEVKVIIEKNNESLSFLEYCSHIEGILS